MIVASFHAPRFEKWLGCDYDPLLSLLDASCRRFGLQHIVISDNRRPGLDTLVCRLPENLMEAILEGQRQCLSWAQEPVLFVGADCLIARDPRPVGQGDITITTSKTFADCEMNTGAIWCMDPGRCEPVWQAALDAKPREWGEDQKVLYAAVLASGLDVRDVPAEQQNWAPDDVRDSAGLPTVVHFRGQRKSWMPEWAARHLDIR